MAALPYRKMISAGTSSETWSTHSTI